MIYLFNEDCLKVMEYLSKKNIKIDYVLTDPPYEITACKWDTIIPFDKMWENINKLIKEKSAISLFGSEPFSSALRMSNIKDYKYDWYWEKTTATGFQLANCKPLKNVENIVCFSKGVTYPKSNKKMIYFPQGLIPFNKDVRHGVNHILTKTGSNKKSQIINQQYTNFPRQVLKYSKDGTKYHPTQKPVALLEYLIKTYTKEEEIVLDFCAGSMSTAIACINTNRNCIVIEKDFNTFNIGLNRLNSYLKENNFSNKILKICNIL